MPFDINLKSEDVQSLSSREALAAFFGALGYNTENRIKQTAANLGITAESVAREITHVEQLATHDGLLHVYLFELDSVTVALTNALSRAFRNKQGNYLLVLTSDYERIDFVLVEKTLPIAGDGLNIGEKQVTVLPHVLTINRRKPSRRELRILRRFTYTESDPLYQFEKLKSAYAIFDWSEDHFNNRTLFADYFLQERLRDLPEWKEDTQPFYRQVRELFTPATAKWAGKREAEMRREFFEKMFALLGFGFKAGKRGADDAPAPDYVLFDREEKKVLAVCLCYPWARSLDGKDDQRDQDTPEENPSAVVVSILKDGSAPWAIVTNGKHWRLYNAKTSSIATSFYEADLEEILAEPTRLGAAGESFDLSDSLKYFWLLFRSQAFMPRQEVADGETRTTTFLDAILRGSEAYAKRLGERLKERVFDEVFIHFAEGFIDFIKKRDGKNADLTQAKLDEVFQGTLTLLYRLLFLLYAEARDLLPVKEVRGFYEKSLSKLKREIAEAAGEIADEVDGRLKKAYTVSDTAFYDRLLDLFRTIDQGDSAINVPVYNGGLFLSNPSDDDDSQDAELARFLLRAKVPDRHLACGLDLLARDIDDKRGSLVPIDYKSLGVRHLGSIYEGLLEFKLRVAPVKMAVVKGKKTEEVMPYDEAVKEKRKILTSREDGAKTERLIPKGRLYLENDKRERKATGSYYTPDYIVKYIVENTVGPVLQEKFDKLRPEFRKAQKGHSETEQRKKALDNTKLSKHLPLTRREKEESSDEYKDLIHAFFDVKVLDPAMGSGHFLVEAADFISDRMIDFLNGFPWNPVHLRLKETRDTILEEMEKQGINIDRRRLDDNNLIRRYVLKRCIYGVDLNLMAVELAKVSLWLNCFTLGAPLSFLDHHLKCGNSLIGATVDEVRRILEKDLFGNQFAGLLLATQTMIHVGELSDVTAEQVKESRKSFRDASSILGPFKEVLDLWTSQHFGNDAALQLFRSDQFPQIGARWKDEVLKADIRRAKVSSATRKKTAVGAVAIPTAEILAKASETKGQHRFFHWELEFPEVFYEKGGKKDNAGFDAVVGNPPYVNVVELDDITRNFLLEQYSFANGRVDIYLPFMEKALQLLCLNGRTAYITPNKWYVYGYGKKAREAFYENYCWSSAVDLSLAQSIFEDADTYSQISVIAKCPKSSHSDRIDVYRFVYDKPHLISDLAEAVSSKIVEYEQIHISRLQGLPDKVFAPRYIGVAASLVDKCRKLGDEIHESFEIEQLIRIGSEKKRKQLVLNESSMKNLPSEARKIIDADELAHWEIDWEGRYLLYRPSELYNPKTPKIFEIEKIFLKDTSSSLTVVPDFGEHNARATDRWYYALNTVYGLIPKKKNRDWVAFVTACLNSKLLDAIYRVLFGALTIRGGFIRFREYIQYLPIRRISFTTPSERRKALAEKGRKLYERCLSEKSYQCVLEFVAHHLGQQPEESDVVHDLLAFLAEEMVRLNKDKQAESKRFLGWLQKKVRLAEGIDSLTGKTTIKNYLGDYQKNEPETPFAEILKVLQKNKNKLGASLSQPALAAELQKEYEASLAKLLPLKERLALTDKLIDQVVYKLYELTEDEVAIVEGMGK